MVLKKTPKKALFRSIFQKNGRLGDLLVLCGILSPAALRSALREQKITPGPLGRILVRQGNLNRAQLGFALALQGGVRCAVAVMVLAMALCVGPERKAHAAPEQQRDLPAVLMVLTDRPDSIPAPGVRRALFGTVEQASAQTESFTKWHEMFARFNTQAGQAQEALARLRADLKPLAALSLKDMAAAVNALMNKQPYIADQENWGRSDYWATPVEFLDKGGDCEDFAIAKYAALRALGVPEERLRLAIVQDTQRDMPHAVLAVYTPQGVFVLDNQIKTLVAAEQAGRYRPIYSINRQSWWLHTSPRETMIAAAAGE
ncbi:MAG: transglutaminase-like cysteine peptidase [Alphaproteobacteria bacterium]|nr:transglutaminase-like cysteine peptidase [Alphaproteobacteria bacterium]